MYKPVEAEETPEVSQSLFSLPADGESLDRGLEELEATYQSTVPVIVPMWVLVTRVQKPLEYGRGSVSLRGQWAGMIKVSSSLIM